MSGPLPSRPDAGADPAPDPWSGLRRYTAARIALGRTGGSLPTRELLDFSRDFAAARDAVHAPFDARALAAELRPLGPEVIPLSSAAPDRTTYLRRPDLGRRLSAESRMALESASRARTGESFDLALIVSDGLSALAAHRQAAPFLAALLPRLGAAGWTLAPVCVVTHARVALEDEVGSVLGARIALILLGERPGLAAPDSLGAYFVHGPRIGNSDADRNCVSNIRPEGLPPGAAAEKVFLLLSEARRLGISGVSLKDASPAHPGRRLDR